MYIILMDNLILAQAKYEGPVIIWYVNDLIHPTHISPYQAFNHYYEVQ